MPYPNGCAASGGFRLRRAPSRSNPPLPVSTTEWIASENIAELPVMNAAVNLVAAMARLPAMAAITAVRDSLFTRPKIANESRCENRQLRLATGAATPGMDSDEKFGLERKRPACNRRLETCSLQAGTLALQSLRLRPAGVFQRERRSGEE